MKYTLFPSQRSLQPKTVTVGNYLAKLNLTLHCMLFLYVHLRTNHLTTTSLQQLSLEFSVMLAENRNSEERIVPISGE